MPQFDIYAFFSILIIFCIFFYIFIYFLLNISYEISFFYLISLIFYFRLKTFEYIENINNFLFVKIQKLLEEINDHLLNILSSLLILKFNRNLYEIL